MCTIEGETQWNDAQVRFGPYDSSCALSNDDDGEDCAIEIKHEENDDDIEEEEENYGASGDFQMDREKFSFVFPHPTQRK
eukprot:12198843-Ditylum_brightwellii.AAC.1